MQLNRIETLVVNNPLRAALQRHYEAPLLIRMGGRLDGCTVLEIGCGRGVGSELLLSRFGASRVQAMDLDPRMVQRARRRLEQYGDRVRVETGDVNALPFADGSFDAVLDSGVIHHVPDWRRALVEIGRVLRPGGRFYFEEVTKHALDRVGYRLLFDHPREDRFTPHEFVDALTGKGFRLAAPVVTRFFGDFVIGVATNAPG